MQIQPVLIEFFFVLEFRLLDRLIIRSNHNMSESSVKPFHLKQPE